MSKPAPIFYLNRTGERTHLVRSYSASKTLCGRPIAASELPTVERPKHLEPCSKCARIQMTRGKE